jgi:protein SCO1/2
MIRAVGVIVALVCGASLRAQTYGLPPILNGVGIDQRMGAQAPPGLSFTDESGQAVTLGKYFGKPVILALVYYQCPSLCNLVLSGTVRVVRDMGLEPGRDFEMVAVSFDPRDDPAIAAAKKRAYMQEFNRPNSGHGWHFLTGAEEASRALADELGFHYRFDPSSGQYAHPSAILILTPAGKVTRYFYGINYPPRDVRLGLVEAANGDIGSPIDQVLLYCFHYDPATGKYGLIVMNILRAAGAGTVGFLAILITLMLRRERSSGHG